MKLGKIIEDVRVTAVIGNVDCQIDNIRIDSSSVTKGSLFVCLKGGDFDGHDFISQVENYGAKAVVCERELNTSLTQIIVENCRKALGKLCSAFYGHPSKSLRIIGVTGTNGKTTTSKLIYDVLNASGINCGLIGTMGTFYNGKFFEQNLTTPDPTDLHRIFSEMKSAGVKAVVMEVSAHSIFLDKINGIRFEGGVFTNLTQDHLDFFENMEAYGDAKLKFFRENELGFAVTNSDDAIGRKISEMLPTAISYGIENPADVFAINLQNTVDGERFVINLFDCVYDVKLNLIGKFNVYNALAAATACALFGVGTYDVVKSIEKARPVEGRLEKVYCKDFSVIVDYAHTPDGLEQSLRVLKQLCEGKLICVFGCGGNRDVGKRSIMGRISGELADFTIITSDNPRYEEPMDIIFEIEKGVVERTKKYIIIQEREDAIRYALSIAKRGDVILIAGKGGEKYQEVLGVKRLYNDKETVTALLKELRS